MNRAEFIELRDLPGKRVVGDIVLKRKKDRSMVLASGAVTIEADGEILANLHIEFNEETEAKSVNVMLVGVGPVCRLEVDSRPHRPAGRSHKHALKTPECPSNNLPLAVIDRPDLAGQSLEHVFAEFCAMAHIEHSGKIKFPD
jgi:hypothetical protein